MKKYFPAVLAALLTTAIYAQDATSARSPFTFSGYVEGYYSYDSSNPGNHDRPGFFYSYDRHNEVSVNLAMAKVNYATNNVRGNFALMAGSYPNANLAAEPRTLQNIFEANAGAKVSKNRNLWIDAGILPSHIGFESAIGKDGPNLTRSILADNSPYYEAGVKLGYTSATGKWYLALMYLNGWQRMQRIDGNQTPAFGTQLTYKPGAKTLLNWSTYIGNEQPDSIRRWRYFNNFYGQFRLSEKVNLTVGFDLGAQESPADENKYDVWYSPVLIAQYKPIAKLQLAARAEYYQDKNGVIIVTGSENGFRTYGFSANVDYLPAENVMFRIEARALGSKDDIFMRSGQPANSDVFITTALAISL